MTTVVFKFTFDIEQNLTATSMFIKHLDNKNIF